MRINAVLSRRLRSPPLFLQLLSARRRSLGRRRSGTAHIQFRRTSSPRSLVVFIRSAHDAAFLTKMHANSTGCCLSDAIQRRSCTCILTRPCIEHGIRFSGAVHIVRGEVDACTGSATATARRPRCASTVVDTVRHTQCTMVESTLASLRHTESACTHR